jgi:hypothetical protein
MRDEGARIILKKLAIAGILVFLSLMYAGNCSAQTAQYAVVKSCQKNKCKDEEKGSISIGGSHIYIQAGQEKLFLKYTEKFDHKGKTYYRVELTNIYSGTFIVFHDHKTAMLEIFILGEKSYIETYHFKK